MLLLSSGFFGDYIQRVIGSWSLIVMGEGEYVLYPQPNNFDTEDGSRFFLRNAGNMANFCTVLST